MVKHDQEKKKSGREGAWHSSWKGKMFSWKTTSLEMNVVLVVQSSNLYPLNPVGYLRKIACVNQGENFVW